MKVLIVTTPIRPIPTNYPPIGSLSLIKYLRKHGFSNVEFYNIDGNRPSYAEVVAHIRSANPDVLGISAVVSTAYEYTKKLSLDVKKMLPGCLVVVGGNLAASAEILLRKTGTDLCVLGEGEKIFLNVVRRAEETRRPSDFADIPGLMLLDARGHLVNTGYEEQLPADEVYDVDWEDLFRTSDPDIYLTPLFDEDGNAAFAYKNDPRTYEPHRRDKKLIIFPSSKGCVARCTFCHRWDKGVRYIPVDVFMRRLDYLIGRYNVGFASVAGENFGSDRKWVLEFCEAISKRDVLWSISAMRTRTVTPELIDVMVASGCTSIVYGVESGSPRMLEIMEKKTSLQDNLNAMTWTIERGMPSVIQLVIGMPGETSETIGETIDFCKVIQTLSPNVNPNDLSINYAQALPGTPLYEFARHNGLIGSGLDGEEAYLLKISDRDAHDEFTTLNFTTIPTLLTQTWRPLITIETNYAYVKKFGLAHYRRVLLNDANYFKRNRKDVGYFANPKRLVDTSIAADTLQDVREAYALESESLPSLWSLVQKGNLGLAMICYPVFFYRIRHFLILLVFLKNLFRYPFQYNLNLISEYISFRLFARNRNLSSVPAKSLRKTVSNDLRTLSGDSPAMAPLRAGR
jgi:radical SAM superfamily enzyme YgiQ (UPF0313 family)